MMASRKALAASALVALLAMTWPARLSAHVGSPDVFFEGNAGPYRLLVAISPPVVVPGVADIDVRVLDGSPAPREVHVVPLRLTGPGAIFAPVADRAARSDVDPSSFKAALWMMEAGAWQVRITLDGDAGTGQVSVPVDALASRTLKMDRGIAIVLLPLGLFLVLGFVAIVGAGVGQAQAQPGQPISPERKRRARIARVVALAIAVIVLVLGNFWWDVEARAYDAYIYKPLELEPELEGRATTQPAGQAETASTSTLRLTLHDPGWLTSRVLDDLVPDHGHTMHLFAVRMPALDRLLHLHPAQQEAGTFSQQLPTTAAGRYRLFADIVHANGLPETAVADLELPAIASTAPTEDDSDAEAPAAGAFDPTRVVATLADGARMTWDRAPGSLKSGQPYLLTFHVQASDGSPVHDLVPYMGMSGHAIILRRDLSVFAHVHPFGTAPMASLAMTASTRAPAAMATPTSTTSLASSTTAQAPRDNHAPMPMSMPMPTAGTLPPTVTFPYGFPKEGDYRLFIQVKRTTGVQTGVFDIHVD